MRLITEDNDNKKYLVYLTKEEIDEIERMANYYEVNAFKDYVNIPNSEKRILCDIFALCDTISLHIFEGGEK